MFHASQFHRLRKILLLVKSRTADQIGLGSDGHKAYCLNYGEPDYSLIGTWQVRVWTLYMAALAERQMQKRWSKIGRQGSRNV